MKKRNLVLFGTVATLSLALAGSIGAVTASAASITNGGENTGTTTVTYTVEEKWTVTIPDSITIDLATGKSTGEDKVTIAADSILASGNKTLKVTVSGDFTLEADGGETLEYELRVSDDSSNFSEGALTTGGDVVSAAGGAAETSKYLEAKLKEGQKATAAGTYKDELTFSVEQEEA